MKRVFMVVLFAIIIALVGCQMNDDEEEKEQVTEEPVKPRDMEKEELPDLRAFQDEFTRGFLQSTKETRPGYYPFLSGTGTFVMDFPEEGKIAENLYHLRNQIFEMMKVNVGSETSDILHTIRIQYTGHLEEELHKKSRLGQLHSELEGDLDFERVEEEQQIYHISGFELEKEEDYHEIYGYAAFIFNNQGQGGIEIVYNSHCLDNCNELRESDKQSIYDWIKSVQFLEEPVRSDENDG